MVAYSFKPFFEHQIACGIKPHTVRGNGRRHARPGELVQLYVGMRTKHCRKIVDPDPICSNARPIVIETSSLLDCYIASVEIDGHRLDRDAIETFARMDGFAPEWIGASGLKGFGGTTARENMGAFWRQHHADVSRFEGTLINWEFRA